MQMSEIKKIKKQAKEPFKYFCYGNLLCQSLKSQSEGTCWLKNPLRDEDQSGNGPRYVPGFFVIISESLRSDTRLHPDL